MQLLFNKLITDSAYLFKDQFMFSGNLKEKKKSEDILPQVAFDYVAAAPIGTVYFIIWEI